MSKAQSSTEDLLQRAVAAIVEVSAARRIVLFGSHARGDAGPDSDLDLLVVAPPGRHRRDTARAIYRRLSRFGHALDVVVVTADDVETYRDSPGLIISTALAEGREIYAA